MKFDFLDLLNNLLLLRVALTLLLLVLVLAEVHDAADRRVSLGGHLNQIQPEILRFCKRFLKRKDAELRIGVGNQTNRLPAVLTVPTF